MLTKLLRLALALVFVFGTPIAHAFVDPPILTSPNPVAAGQPVSISIRAGVCDLLIAYPAPAITRVGNSIRMVVQSAKSADPAFCTYPIITANIVVGTFEPGTYSLQVDRVYPGGGGPVTETLGFLAFTVAGLASTPALGPVGGVALTLMLLFVSVFALRRRRSGLLILAIAVSWFPAASRAQPVPKISSIEVLLSATQGAPTADQVVAYFGASNRGSSQPPLKSLITENPQSAAYLLPIRAKGDFLTYLRNNPTSTRAKLENYVLIVYPKTANLQNALSALRSDPYVETAYLPATGARFSSAQLIGFGVGSSSPYAGPISNGPQYGRDDLNADAAWQLAGGYALVGDVDSGLYTTHPAFLQFASNGQYLGGNFLPGSSVNIGFAGIPPYPLTWSDPNVDEEYPLLLPPNTVCNSSNQTQNVPPAYAGHGTHVAGLLAANPNSSYGVKGTCLHCGVAMWKITYPACGFDGIVYATFNPDQVASAITYLSDRGAQVINLSLGDRYKGAGFCASNPGYSWCRALTYAFYRDVTIVASAGNSRTQIQFPANDIRTLDAGGFDQNVALWDLSPPRPNMTNCPPPNLTNENLGDECGSNFTVNSSDPPQELMASSNKALSTTYPGLNWDLFSCGDGYPGPGWGNGKGLCTGTSMSAPQISGVVGILRSINPLVGTSVPVPNPNLGQTAGIRTVLARTTFEAQASPGSWSPTFGYGHPDAAAASRMMMGQVAGRQVLNRVTPLFRVYSSVAQDYADTTSPQFATALLINSVAAYQPQGSSIPGYASFPPAEPGQPALPAPKAMAYVLTTEYKPWPNYPALLPLYLLDRSRNWPLGCTTGTSGCNSNHQDYVLLTTATELQQAHTDGFNLRTIQGYIYQTCTPEPACIPPGAQKFYRECNTTIDDCATFLESERSTFEGNGYTSAYPTTSSTVLGYAYPGTDTDGDGLIDGLEYVIGTNPTLRDSDGTGFPDSLDYPMAGVPASDPCLGPGAINCPANFIFKNGFE